MLLFDTETVTHSLNNIKYHLTFDKLLKVVRKIIHKLR